MADNAANSIGKALSDVNIGTMVASIGQAIATAQQSLDMNSLRVAQMLTGEYQDEKGQTQSSLVMFDGEKVSLMELGFTPNFYQFVDTIIEVRIAISMKGETQTVQSSSVTSDDTSSSASSNASNTGYWWWGWGSNSGNSNQSRTTATTSQVNASYANKYSYSVEGSSLLRTKLVPVPAPALLSERIRAMVNEAPPGVRP